MKIFDAHCDTILNIVDDNYEFEKSNESGHIDLPRLLKNNVGCQVFAAWASTDQYDAQSVIGRSQNLIQAVIGLENHPDTLIPKSATELESLFNPDKNILGILPAIEGGEAIGNTLHNLDLFKELGIRYITLAWGDNQITGSSFGKGYGLTDFGKKVVRRMSDLNILIDVSHMSDEAFNDLLEETDRPFIASHSNCRQICSSLRNLTDDQIRRISERGGVIGVNFVSGFLTTEAAEAQAPYFKEFQRKAKADPDNFDSYFDEAYEEISHTQMPPFSSILDHIERLVEVGGIDSVGFGSDFDGFRYGPVGLQDCSAYTLIIQQLRQRGFTLVEIEKISWKNWVRAFSWSFE